MSESRIAVSRHLRNNPTLAERRLWRSLRNRQVHGLSFTRQFAIDRFVVDFCCRERKLIVEVDGGGHASNQRYDTARDNYLAARGYRVLRFWNNEVMTNMEDVLSRITRALEESWSPDTH